MAKQKLQRVESDTSPEIAVLKAAVDGAKAAVQKYTEASNQLFTKILNAPKNFIPAGQLKADIMDAQKNVSTLRFEDMEAQLQVQREQTRYEVVDNPFEAEKPIFPKKGLFAATAFTLYIFFAFTWEGYKNTQKKVRVKSKTVSKSGGFGDDLDSQEWSETKEESTVG